MAPESSDLTKDWKQLQVAGEELATLLTEAADKLSDAGLPPALSLSDDVRRFRTQLADFRKRIDPDCPAERAAIEEHISYTAIQTTLSRQAERGRLQDLLQRVLRLRHTDESDFAPLTKCHKVAHRLVEQPNLPDNADDWQALYEERHPLQALLLQVAGAANLSDDAWAELGDRLTNSYGRALATAAARGKLVFADVPAFLSKPMPLPAEGATAGLSEPTITEALVVSEPPPPLVDFESVTLVSPDLHAPDDVTGPSFLDGDCPFNPLNPSSSLTQALASSSDHKVAPSPETTEQPPVVAPAPEAIASPASHSLHDGDEVHSFESSPARGSTAVQLDSIHNGTNYPASPTAEAFRERALAHGAATPVAPVVSAAAAMTEATIFDLPAPTTTRAHVSVEELAQMAADADEGRRVPLLCDLQIELLRTGRYSLAYQLTYCLDQRPSRPRRFLPLWLVRALALGERVVFPKGSLTLQLQQDFGEFRRESLLKGDREWNEALGFFLRAAAIRPAVLAPVSRAAGVLQAVGINENLCHLYNYCSRIVRFADQDQGDVLQQLRPNEYEGPRSVEYRQLLRDIDEWRTSHAQRAIEYSPQTPLFSHEHWTLRPATAVAHPDEARQWAHWQELQRIVNHLLAPVTANETHAAGWVRQEVQKLTAEVERGQEEGAGTVRPRYDSVRLSLSSEEMRSYLVEALAFANRWLALQGPLPAAIGEAFVPAELQELRNSILERHEPALVELLACDEAQDSRLISAGIAACRRAMQNVHDLFDPRVPPPCREAEIPHVLHGDLLKIPHLALNARWEPELDPLALEMELLELLSKPDPTWTEVWRMHSDWHDHTATERLLELDVWGNAERRQALERERQADVERSREALGCEVVELQQMLDEITEMETLSPGDLSGLTSRLERIEKTLERSADFFAVEVQLAQIRTTLERKRSTYVDRRRAPDPDHSANGNSNVPSLSPEPVRGHNGQLVKPVVAAETTENSHRESVWVMDFN